MRHPVFHRLSAVAFVFGSAPPTHAQTLAPPDPFAALDRGLRPDVAPPAGTPPRWSLGERMRHYRVPGVAIAILSNGVVQAAGFGLREAGTRDAVDRDTLFSVGSISKLVTAATTLRLVARGQVDLDRDVGAYLKRWKLPPSAAVPEPKVSLRMLMTHSAGFGVHGFADYQPAEPLPTLLQVLDGTGPAKNEAVRFKHVPGLRSDYSGGGVTVEQMTIEDATGRPLAELAKAEVFAPLGMRRSTFESPLSPARSNIAKAHDAKGAVTALPRGWESFAESGASGLWTSASDLGRLLGGLIKSYQGRADFLPQSLATAMMTRVSPGVFGLGPRLGGSGTGRHFFHMGANQSYLSFIEGYPETGEGFVILTNGGNGGGLIAEIRNALTDAIGQGAHAELRGVVLRTPPSPDFRGKYRLDAAVPLALRGALTDNFEYDSVEIDVVGDAVRIVLPGQETPTPLIPLGPAQFALPGLYTFILEFSRDAFGTVRGVTISMPEAASMAYYARE
ncbi:serine hydrolase [Sphingomonas psychrotolerans]|uniref:Serine hydrolase n=2 Tax=Sphingomonas psychrotolerans TaxID=1327635 RepID=A0A2K8MPR0_9SPHN|nr:serine hydrolase [Sphingomonas psychrotolerans]